MTQEEYYNQLTGKTIKKVHSDPWAFSEHEPLFGLEFTDGTMAWIMRDPEGNGPGHLDIEAKK